MQELQNWLRTARKEIQNQFKLSPGSKNSFSTQSVDLAQIRKNTVMILIVINKKNSFSPPLGRYGGLLYTPAFNNNFLVGDSTHIGAQFLIKEKGLRIRGVFSKITKTHLEVSGVPLLFNLLFSLFSKFYSHISVTIMWWLKAHFWLIFYNSKCFQSNLANYSASFRILRTTLILLWAS